MMGVPARHWLVPGYTSVLDTASL